MRWTGVGYIRKGNPRIFYKEFVDEVKILRIAVKGAAKLMNQVERQVNELYPFIDINYKNL